MAAVGQIGVALVGGGSVIGPGAVGKLLAVGVPVVLVGDAVASHGIGLHSSATMITGSSVLFVNGVSVCVEGSEASCGHTLANGYVGFNAV